MTKCVASTDVAASCFFRTSIKPPFRKALLQITERCNLHCAHCFVSASDHGDTLSREIIRDVVIPRLESCRVRRVTLTGGEPFTHPDVMGIIEDLRCRGMPVGVCTNGTLVTEEQMVRLRGLGGIHVNVSLDGFREASHGRFRGDPRSFTLTLEAIRQLSVHHLLQGILVTPNRLASPGEYAELCEFAGRSGASYVLMNPLSPMGRGVASRDHLATEREEMIRIQVLTRPCEDAVEVVCVRFPNDSMPLSACQAGNIIYVFANGDVAICPYLVFAARSPHSQHRPDEFVVGNVLRHADIGDRLKRYAFRERYRAGDNPKCRACPMKDRCGKGCPAAVVASGEELGGVDEDVCAFGGRALAGSSDTSAT